MALGPSKQQISNAEFEDMLYSLSKRIDRTKVMYEQYFMGIQRMAPGQLHREVERTLRELKAINIRNTSLRFRLTTITQKFGSYNTYWRRTMREIEQGRYVRDVARASRRVAQRGGEMPEEVLASLPKRVRDRIMRDRAQLQDRAQREAAHDSASKSKAAHNVHQISESDALLGDDFDLDAMFSSITDLGSGKSDKGGDDANGNRTFESATRVSSEQSTTAETGQGRVSTPAAASPPPLPPRPPRPIPRRPPPRAGGNEKPPPGMSAGEGKQLFDRYVKAQRMVGKSTDKLTYDKLMRSLNKQAKGIMDKHKAAGVSFNVTVKDNRVVLKARPQKGEKP